MGVYLLKKSFFARFLAHNTKNKQKTPGLAFMDEILTTASSYGLNCVPHFPKFVCWSPNPQCDGIWRRGLWEVLRVRWGHEGGALMTGSVSLKDETTALALTLPSMWRRYNEKVAVYTLGRGPSPTGDFAATLNLSASRTVTNTCVLFKPSSPWYFVMSAQTDRDTGLYLQWKKILKIIFADDCLSNLVLHQTKNWQVTKKCFLF